MTLIFCIHFYSNRIIYSVEIVTSANKMYIIYVLYALFILSIFRDKSVYEATTTKKVYSLTGGYIYFLN